MRTLTASLIAVAVLGLVAVVLWQDAELDPEVVIRLRTPPRLPQEVNVFYPLAGFDVSAGEDPASAGYGATTRMNALLEGDAGVPDESALDAAWTEPSLEIVDEAGILCAPVESGCVARLVARRAVVADLAERHRVLLDRYATLAGFPAFQTEVSPHASAPFPRFRSLIDTHRLWLADSLGRLVDGEREAFAQVAADVRFLRRLLATADNLLMKMVAVSMLADSLHVLAAAMDFPGAAPPAALPRFSPSERSVDLALTGEFRLSVSMVANLHRHPEFYRDLGVPESMSPALLRPLFKPNRSVNLAWRCFEQVRERVRRARLGYEPEADSTDCEPALVEWVLNPIGAILLSVATPDFRRHAARIEDVGGLIALVNLKRAIREARIDAAGVDEFVLGPAQHVKDPSTGKEMHWDQETRTLWFESAEPDSKLNRLALDPLG